MVFKRLISLVLAIALMLSLAVTVSAGMPITPKNHTRTNVVVFAYFTDTSAAEVERMKSAAYRNEMVDMFGMSPDSNDATTFAGYLNTVSYGQEKVQNVFLQDNGTVIEPVALSISQESIKGQFADYSVISQITKALDGIDLSSHGITSIDTFSVVLGTDEQGADSTVYPTVWPHQATMTGTSLDGHDIRDINILNTDRLGSTFGGAGLIAHEYLHSLGYPDFYTETAYTPVGGWDIMADTSVFMQYPLAYARYYFSNWIELDTITTSTTSKLVVNDQSDKNGNQAYILQSQQNPTELFVVEYRAKGNSLATDETFLDAKIPGEGLIIYRVDTNVSKLSNKFGKTGVYVFRNSALGSVSENSDNNTYFTDGQTFGTSDTSVTDNALTFSDGSNSGIVIKNIQNETDGMSFEVEIPKAESFDLWDDKSFPASSATSISSLMVNDVLHVATVENKDVVLRSFDGTNWTTLQSFSTVDISTSQTTPIMVNIGSDIYYAYYEFTSGGASGKIVIKKHTGGAWVDFTEIPDITKEDFDIALSQDNSKMFVSYYDTTLDRARVRIIDINTPATFTDVTLDEITNVTAFGQTRLTVVNNNVYAIYLNTMSLTSLNAFKINTTDFSYEKIADAPVNLSPINSFEAINYNNNVFVLAAGSFGSTGITMWASSKWIPQTNIFDGSYKGVFDPSLNIIDGNVYALTTDHNSPYNLRAYRHISTGWVHEGEIVETITAKTPVTPTLTKTSTGIMYATFLNDGVPKVESKGVSVKLLSLKVTAPNKTDYIIGDNIDLTGLVVTANYSDGNSRVLGASEYTLEGFDTNKSGEGRIATITFNGSTVSNTFGYNVYDKAIPLHHVKATSDHKGTISPSGDLYLPKGSSQEFTFTPNSGYEIASVMVNGNSVTPTNNKYTLENIASTQFIVVTYKQIGSDLPDPGVEPPVTDFENNLTTSTVITQSTLSGGMALASTSESLNEAFAAATYEASQQNTDPRVEVLLDKKGITNGYSVVMPASTIVNYGMEYPGLTLKVTGEDFSMLLDNTTLKELAFFASDFYDDNLTFNFTKVDSRYLTPEQQKTAGTSTVFKLTITLNGKEFTNFNGGVVTITAPYELSENEDPNSIKVSYLAPDGTLTQHNATYDKATGLITFTTTHFSEFVVTSTFLPTPVPTPPTTDSTSAAISPLTGASK